MFNSLILRCLILTFITAYSNIGAQVHHPEIDSLGIIDFNISCSPASQLQFNQAMTLLHHMTYPQAREMFLRLLEKDSACAMAYWGFAMTLFQPLWPTRPGPKELNQGWTAISKAKLLVPKNEKEILLINAAEAFFRDPESADYWKRIRDWKERMEIAWNTFPLDNEVAAFYALALLATIPADQISSTNNALAADILNKILSKNPSHPGAMHYLIHANDTPGRERESIEILRKYKEIAPDNPHALHMPTHIYTRLGDWPEVINGNINAANAALKFPAGDKGQYIWDEFPHAIEYLIYAYMQMGNDNEALKQLKRLSETDNLEPTFKTAFHISSTRARYALERREWKEAASIKPQYPGTITWNRFPWPEAIGWFAHGLGSIHIGNTAEAGNSLEHLQDLENITINKKEILFARNIRVLQLELAAFIADDKGLSDSAVSLLNQAAELEASTPKHAVTPAPTIPANELLGDLLYAHQKYEIALEAYKNSLKTNPNRFNSLLGAARTSYALEDKDSASLFYQKLIDISSDISEREELKEARKFVQK